MKLPLCLPALLFLALPLPAENYEEDRLEKEVLVNGLEDGMEMDVLPDGRILVIERQGGVKLYEPAGKKVTKLGQVPAVVFGEVGLLGMVAAPDFDRTGWVYLYFCPKEKSTTLRLSRFTVAGEKLDLGSEKKLLEFRIDGPEAAIHMGGGLARDSKGNIYIGTGDNSPPIPELPVDQRPGHEVHDAQRSAANSKDLRGKVLRIHPEPDGKYTIPAGNLFPGGRDGRPEIYAMGCRNPYRVMIDPKTDWLYWGDVGPNVDMSINVGPNGYDEINQARAAGNFGWPMFVGPNEPYSEFDFVKRKAGRRFDVKHPENRSKNNTGLKVLPPPQPAFLWYPTQESKEWPVLGSGGRSGMVGPTYYFDANLSSAVKLPDRFDRTLFVFEWMRNWIVACKLDASGKLREVEPFAKHLLFRRPIDMRLGPDGALYVLEYGDKWSGNTDGQIVRLVYRRGNRPPVARLVASTVAGRQPLKVTFNAGNSFDKDAGDKLSYSWSLGDRVFSDRDPVVATTFLNPGTYTMKVTVTDSHGASDSAAVAVRVGNAMPEVRFDEPAQGGFFDWGEPVGYRVEVADAEDGRTADGTIPADRVIVRAEYQVRRRAPADEALHPGLALMRKTTCFSCHTTEGQSKGPPYQQVALKYKGQKDAREMLAKKVVAGGAGVWGAYPMPPHPQHTLEQTRQMVDWVLSLTRPPTMPPVAGIEGGFVAALNAENFPTGFPDAGVQLLTASYTDNGAGAIPPLTGERTVVLHARRKKAAYHDYGRGVQVVDDLEDEHGMIGWFGSGDYVGFAEMNLEGIERIVCRVRGRAGTEGSFEVRLDSPTGPLLGRVAVPAGTGAEVPMAIPPTGGLHDVYFVAVANGPEGRQTISLNWAEFRDSPAAAAARKQARDAARKRIEVARANAPKARPFVRAWTVAELGQGPAKTAGSAERGANLFRDLNCIGCHRMGREGGAVGPDLTDLGQRYQKKPAPREAILTEIIEPSKVIEEKYRTHVLTLDNGQQLAGIIIAQTPEAIRIAANPAKPDEIREIPRARIEEMRISDVSLMPTGLLNTLSREEVLDLLAYLEGSGNRK